MCFFNSFDSKHFYLMIYLIFYSKRVSQNRSKVGIILVKNFLKVVYNSERHKNRILGKLRIKIIESMAIVNALINFKKGMNPWFFFSLRKYSINLPTTYIVLKKWRKIHSGSIILMDYTTAWIHVRNEMWQQLDKPDVCVHRLEFEHVFYYRL